MGEEICQEVNLAQGLARKCNHQIGNHNKGVARVGCEITNSCINFGNTVVSGYAQSNNGTSKEKFLITMSIQSKKIKSNVVPSEI
jgi:hypothetical protein